ncbi:PD-(D/E)XK nuclease domain-containing protein [Candidatus Merdisoma sp. JLR.KK006]|uniref:PD-(D/E)XK nuclease domain-containing protein n=1 Tax=Candidatus Merdisoma sp. JLR.KK006 TaxID=3112626 RepID=UPI002FF070F6
MQAHTALIFYELVNSLLSAGRVRVNTATFHNDMTTFHSKDDVLTLLIHLGYLAYDFASQEVFIPNYEISGEFKTALQGAGWDTVVKAVDESEQLLRNTWNKREDLVAAALEQMHMETSILTYNDENSLSCVMSLAYYSARIYYTEIRELPTGEGYADIVYLPRKNHLDKPALLIELKWDKSKKGAIEQIKERKYGKALEDYVGKLLLVGINYDKKTKKHECVIEEYHK